MNDKAADTFDIQVDYEDEQLREQIEKGSTHAMGWIRSITAGNATIVGGEDSSGMREYLVSFFGGTIQCLTRAMSGERSHFTAANGPVYVVIEPENSDSVRFLFAYKKESIGSKEAREDYEPNVVVQIEPLVTEILDSANEFLTHVAEWNPDLANSSDAFRGLREDIDMLEEAFADLSDDPNSN